MVAPKRLLQVKYIVSYFICGTVLAAFCFMVIPIWRALAAGIASVSLVVFSGALVLLIGSYFLIGVHKRTTMLVMVIAGLGLVLPQVAFLQASDQYKSPLKLEPDYLRFSGASDIAPSTIIPYKSIGTTKLSVALYEPITSSNRSLVVLVHGGGWRYGNYLETGMWPRTLTQAGYTVASIEYRRSTDTYHSWKDTPEDVRDAMSYIKKLSPRYNFDNSRIHLMGQSAGGHLALLESYKHQSVASVISLYAPVDLTFDENTQRDTTSERDFIGGPNTTYADRYRAVSPLTWVNPASPKTLIVHGTYDDLVNYNQALLLSNTLQKNQVQHELTLLPLSGHSFDNQRGGFATQITKQQVLQFLSQ